MFKHDLNWAFKSMDFIFIFIFYFILLYNTVLVLPYIDMNPPRVYKAWTLESESPRFLIQSSPSLPQFTQLHNRIKNI